MPGRRSSKRLSSSSEDGSTPPKRPSAEEEDSDVLEVEEAPMETVEDVQQHFMEAQQPFTLQQTFTPHASVGAEAFPEDTKGGDENVPADDEDSEDETPSYPWAWPAEDETEAAHASIYSCQLDSEWVLTMSV